MREVKPKNDFKLPTANFLDKAIAFVSPQAAARRMKARMMMNITGAYYGGSKSRRSLSQWVVPSGDADSDILPDLETLRDRSNDLVRNNPLAVGAIKTKVTNIGSLKLKSRIDRNIGD